MHFVCNRMSSAGRGTGSRCVRRRCLPSRCWLAEMPNPRVRE
ncbi:hypothetical protein CSUI_008975 [Cystoisospora suis]|uniref:Uncharacterized protein n=1 Tax=Cystoisospora suis TaxID=483139 RepID=A0A2C6KLE5_9APIC|nr:hypothetical protein CSUI_008975 [Cystoisospora suis]